MPLCDSLYALVELAVASLTLSWVTFLDRGISDLVVAALAAMYPVAKGVVLPVRTAVVLPSVFGWACIDGLIAIGSGVGEILGTTDARVPLAAAGAVGVLFLLPNFTELPATVNTAPVFARKSIPRVRWSTLFLTTNSSRLKDISPIFASTVMLPLLSCDAPSTIRMVWLLVSEFIMWGVNPMKSSRMMLLVAPASTTSVVARPPMVREATRVLPVNSTVFGTASGGGFLRCIDSYTVIPRACIC
ncbi:hypothetical protein GQX74_015723 [Glossina fuscipes]|nr:hypothetical protein GQX74_015723 [Glossina fuscipes]